MKLEGFDGLVSRQTLYHWIAKLNWRSRLPRKGKRERKRVGLQAGTSLIYNRTELISALLLLGRTANSGIGRAIQYMGRMAILSPWLSEFPGFFSVPEYLTKPGTTVGRGLRKLLKP